MLSRAFTFIGGIYALVLAGGLIVLLLLLPEAPAWCWLIALGIMAFGVWDIYRALEGKKKDTQVAADLDQRISSLGGGQTPRSEQKPTHGTRGGTA